MLLPRAGDTGSRGITDLVSPGPAGIEKIIGLLFFYDVCSFNADGIPSVIFLHLRHYFAIFTDFRPDFARLVINIVNLARRDG